jgi:hypothetical protein
MEYHCQKMFLEYLGHYTSIYQVILTPPIFPSSRQNALSDSQLLVHTAQSWGTHLSTWVIVHKGLLLDIILV